MELTEDDIIHKYGKKCGHCKRNTLLLHEYGCISFSCGYNKFKRKHELSEIQRKKINFISTIKYAEVKLSCISVDVHRIYEGNDFDKIYEVLTTLKNKKLKINNTLIETKRLVRKN